MEERVQKILSNNGYCSRRKAEELIEKGLVSVNGTVITIGDKATIEDDIIVEGNPIKKEKKVYYAFYKPPRCVTALTDPFYPTIMEYIKIKERVFPVGRLDFNTTGLIILTNDGDFANQVAHPSNETKKTYLARLGKTISYRELKKIEVGMEIEGRITKASKVERIEENIVEITIHEGRKHIVKKIFSELGYKVLTLERTRIGKLDLEGLHIGRSRKLSKKEADLALK